MLEKFRPKIAGDGDRSTSDPHYRPRIANPSVGVRPARERVRSPDGFTPAVSVGIMTYRGSLSFRFGGVCDSSILPTSIWVTGRITA